MSIELIRLKKLDIKNYEYYSYNGCLVRVDIRTNKYEALKDLNSPWQSIEFYQIKYLGEWTWNRTKN